MDDGSRSTWLIVILLLFAAMLFAVMETAFASVSRVRVRTGAEKGENRAKHALYVIEHFDRAITTLLICTNIVHLATASIVTVYVSKRWGVSAVSISTLVTTLVVFFFGEMLPKSLARKYCEPLSLATAGVLCMLMTILRPAAAVLTWVGNAVARLTKGDDETSVTENDLYDIIEDMAEEGKIDEAQGDLISSALQFGDVTVESILTSRMDVAAIDIDMSQEEILAFIKDQNHSRLPVYEGTIDNIIGILHIRRYIRHYIRRGHALDIRPLLYEPYFIHQSTKIDDLLGVMSKKKINLAVVTDNYGGTLGIVTDEDILEELVGEIWDEDDRAVRNVVPMTDGSYSVNPEEHVLDVLDELGLPYTEEQEEEIGRKLMNELAYEAFPQIPVAGDSFRYLGTKISVLVMRHNRIMRLKVRALSEEELEADRDAAEMAGIDPVTGKFISDERSDRNDRGDRSDRSDRNSRNDRSDRNGRNDRADAERAEGEDVSERTASGHSVFSGSDGLNGSNGYDHPDSRNDSSVTGGSGPATNSFTEEDARAFAEGHAYSIRQNPGKHYSRAIHNSGSGNNSNVRKNGGNSGSSNGRKSSSNGSSGNVSNGRRNSHNNANGNTGKNSNGVRGGDSR